MATLNFVPCADSEGAIGLPARRWAAGAFVALLCDYLSDGVFTVTLAELTVDHERLEDIVVLDGVMICDGAGNFSVLAVADVQKAIDVAETISTQAGLVLSDGAGNFSVMAPGPVDEAVARTHDLNIYANNAAAVAGGLAAGAFYRTGGDPDLVCVVHV